MTEWVEEKLWFFLISIIRHSMLGIKCICKVQLCQKNSKSFNNFPGFFLTKNFPLRVFFVINYWSENKYDLKMYSPAKGFGRLSIFPESVIGINAFPQLTLTANWSMTSWTRLTRYLNSGNWKRGNFLGKITSLVTKIPVSSFKLFQHEFRRWGRATKSQTTRRCPPEGK